MGLLWLTNGAGDLATAQDDCGVGSTTASGYSAPNAINGPRSNCWRATARAGDMGLGYQYGSDLDVDHIVVTRADWALTKNGMRLRGAKRDSGGTWSYVSGCDFNTLAASDLIGPRNQDLVVTVDVSTSLRGVGIVGTPASGTEALQISKLFGAVSFELNTPPMFGAQWEELPARTYSKCLQSSRPYEIERRFNLTFQSVTTAKLAEFQALTQLLYWPFYLYDSAQHVFSWKLEHVILEGYQVANVEPGRHALEVSFARLRHYD